MDTLQGRCDTWAPVIAIAFVAEAVPVSWGLAIARQESGFNPTAASVTGGDARRGGSYGICQMSLATAKSLDGYARVDMLYDAAYNARLAAKLCRQLIGRFGFDLRNVAAAYNSGKPFKAAPDSTRVVYVPHVLRYAQEYFDLGERLEGIHD